MCTPGSPPQGHVGGAGPHRGSVHARGVLKRAVGLVLSLQSGFDLSLARAQILKPLVPKGLYVHVFSIPLIGSHSLAMGTKARRVGGKALPLMLSGRAEHPHYLVFFPFLP